MDGSQKSKRFVVVPLVRYAVCDEETGAEILHCGSESLAEFWAQWLAENLERGGELNPGG